MSKYTMTVKEIVEIVTPEVSGWSQTRIDAACTHIFNFNYPIYKQSHKSELESKIIRHYFMREIGLETLELWQFYLETKLNEIMPYYNELYRTLDEKFELLWDVNLTTHSSNKMTGQNDTTFTQNVDTSGNENATEHTSGKEKEDIDKSGTENVTTDRDTTGKLTQHDDTHESGNTSIVDNTATSGNTGIADTKTTKGTNNITDTTDTTSNKDTNGTTDTTGKEVYDGNSTASEHLGESKAIVNADYPQASIDSMGDYASSGSKEEHESDSNGTNTSHTTTDRTGKEVQAINEAFDSTVDYTRDQDTTETENYTRKLDETGTTDYTRKLDDSKDTTHDRTDNTTENMYETQEKRWTETDDRNLTTDGWRTNDIKRTGNESTDSTQNLSKTQTDDGWIVKQGLSGNHTAVELLNEYRESILNIDMMIVNELSDLFMNIY